MSLLSIANILSTRAKGDDFLASVVQCNSADRALLEVMNYVYCSEEFKLWLYEYVDIDTEIANFRLLNDDRANKIVSKRVLTKMRNDIFACKDENKVPA